MYVQCTAELPRKNSYDPSAKRSRNSLLLTNEIARNLQLMLKKFGMNRMTKLQLQVLLIIHIDAAIEGTLGGI